MTPADVTTLWARAFVDELARAGLRDVVVAPGSRSTPLVLAMAGDPRLRLRVHLDERSSAFFALGVGKATGRPAAVVTTSGTATANLLPAVVEAAQSESPLLLLTADRPPRLRDQDANQAIDQVRLFGPYAKSFHEVAVPTRDGPALRHLRALAARAVLAAVEAPAGPVHVNLPFDKPLEPADPAPGNDSFAREHPLAATGRADGAPFVDARPGTRSPSPEDVTLVRGLLGGARRAVLVAGPSPRPRRDGPPAVALAAAAGIPLLADPLSGARWGPGTVSTAVGGYDLFLRTQDVRARLGPDLILRVGASPTSAALQGWLEHHNGVRHVVVDDGRRWKDHGSVATDYVHADPAALLTACIEGAADAAARGGPWLALWRAAAAAATTALDPAGEPHEGDVLRAVAAAVPAGGCLFVSSSMPVRDLDAFGAPREEELLALGNRGASGIDGIVSTAFGVSAGAGAPTVCVLGDIALFHDQNGLLWSREQDASVVFVLVDNDGGGIFHMLPVREHEPHFTTFFATPHGLDFRHAAQMHGVPFEDGAVEDVGPLLARALEAGGTRLIRVRTERESNRRRHREVSDAVARSVLHALG